MTDTRAQTLGQWHANRERRAAKKWIVRMFLPGVIGLGILILIAVVWLGRADYATAPTKAVGAPVGYYHDADHHVSCWTYGLGYGYTAAIACLPDKEVFAP